MVSIRSTLIDYNRRKFIKTKSLISFIEKYGVDFIDEDNRHLLMYICNMTYDQIDILLRYNPNPVFKDKNGEERLVFFNTGLKSLYVLKFLLEKDLNNAFTRLKTEFFVWDEKTRSSNIYWLTYIENIELRIKMMLDMGFNSSKEETYMIIMIKNHDKKITCLFELMLQYIDIN